MSTLDGIKILDLSRILAGPWATQNLADLGATVIKIEKPGVGDDTRSWGPPFVGEGEKRQSTYFMCCNRGKQSVTIDFTKPKGAKLLREMVLKADVFVENFKVGGLKKYGLDYESLRKINPKLIYCSITGFGQGGPYADRPGYDALVQAMGGLMSITGDADGGPQKVGVAITDLMTGMYASTAILAALLERTGSGKGQNIDLSLMGVQVAALANQASGFLLAGKVPVRSGTAHPSIVPYQTFKAKDGDLMVAVANDHQFKDFCQAIGLEENPEYSTNEKRVEHRQELVAMIAKKLEKKSIEEWIDLGLKHGVSVGPVNSVDQVFSDRHVQQTQIVATAIGGQKYVRNPISLSRTPVGVSSGAPRLGEHTVDVLREMGLSESAIGELQQAGVI